MPELGRHQLVCKHEWSLRPCCILNSKRRQLNGRRHFDGHLWQVVSKGRWLDMWWLYMQHTHTHTHTQMYMREGQRAYWICESAVWLGTAVNTYLKHHWVLYCVIIWLTDSFVQLCANCYSESSVHRPQYSKVSL